MSTVTPPLQAVTVYGDPLQLTPGVVDDDAVRAFTFGHCHHLALALHDRTGWPLWVLLDAGNGWLAVTDTDDVRRAANAGRSLPDTYLQQLWAHVVVRRPDGLLVDIKGPRDADTVVADYEGVDPDDEEPGTVPLDDVNQRSRLVPATRAQVASLVSTAPATPGLGEAFVDAVLTLPQTQTIMWPWEFTLHDHIETGLGAAADDADGDRAAYRAAAGDFFDDLDRDYGLLEEALARGMIPADLTSAAHTILDATS